MANTHRHQPSKLSIRLALIATAALSCLGAGCSSKSQDGSTTPPPAAIQAAKQQQTQSVQNNTQMPPQVRAQILGQMNGTQRPIGPHPN